MANDKLYYPDEEFEDVYDGETADMKDEDSDGWYVDEFPDDERGDNYPDEGEDGPDWRDEDIMDMPPIRERRAS